MAGDVFPQTLQTWIGDQIRRGSAALPDLNNHLMSTYAWPLRVYYLGTSSRSLGEPDDVINGFFASRLQQPDFLTKWRASGMRLRRWLMNSFSFYLMELRRQKKRDGKAGELADDAALDLAQPDQAIGRAEAVAMVRQAMVQAEDACMREGLHAHWQMFMRRHLQDAPLPELAREFGVDAARAAVMCRTACRKFRAKLREVMILDGTPPDDVDRELATLVENCAS